MKENKDLLSVTAFLSVLTHAVIILGVSFKLPDIAARSNTDNTLDVVLLNVSNDESPLDTDTVSTNNNLGGGEDDLEANSPLPYKPVNPSPIQSIKKVAEQQAVSSLSPDQYITAKAGELTVARRPAEETKLEAQEKRTGKDILTTKALRQLERERLIAKISQSEEDYNRRPKKTFLSPTTKEHGAAKYLADWSTRVTNIGNANYPVKVKARKLSGMLILTAEINPNGSIANINIIVPSPHKLLNDSALRIVRDAAPFDIFPDEEYFRHTDILVITRSIHFLSDNRIVSTAVQR